MKSVPSAEPDTTMSGYPMSALFPLSQNSCTLGILELVNDSRCIEVKLHCSCPADKTQANTREAISWLLSAGYPSVKLVYDAHTVHQAALVWTFMTNVQQSYH